ncbi:hypothetical protein oselot_149 [Salmonella phage oselot]|uniref:Uncharacterized protein n=6 Tax=Markadamsvirinae TaxID=2732013 RepID=A0A7G8ANX2_9CAUD|nr:hypothetical protein HOU65_gp042 [Salmonella phage Seafire]YP_009858032.1 hypothetical protein HWD22_gp111 [Salmonella phage bombadil]YP_009858857.1 hypothetical protein HWD27_gp118 [Salmonella phage oselot]QNI21457.1 hypothetical protein [Salmonella phage 8sent1748]QNI21824.1 hypothetical protein [Salmonella phage 8sent65]AZF87931.1 hypothetical protein CPT_Seafire_042 [Salmonella phage Seafire]QIN99540.1 hypothetical protein bombadil_141 [Salmonella phage bombadil]QIO01626.1 hypothetica
MKRDFNRYYVIKASHAKEALTKEEQDTLLRLGMKCAKWRRDVGKIPFECLVVEHDWPEYEEVWKMIENRVAFEQARKEELAKGFADAKEHHEIHEEIFLLRGISSYCEGWNAYARKVL